jgi:hypothetical protein
MRFRPLLAAAATLAATAACTTAVQPPALAPDRIEVYLLDHGRTSSLVLPAGDGERARWAYGDWRWYALGETSPGRATAALLWPTQGALGRHGVPGPPGAAAVRAAVTVEIEELHPLVVERDRAVALAARLDALHREATDTLTVSPANGLAFVHHPVPYTLLHSSNRVVAAWLRELGCRVRGTALLSRWRVMPPAGPGAPAGAGPSATIPAAPVLRPSSTR